MICIKRTNQVTIPLEVHFKVDILIDIFHKRKHFMRSFSKIIYSYYKHFSRVLQLSALFLLDDKNVIWIWQGWWPDSGTEDQSGSKTVRWQAERRAAMMIAIRYWRKTRNAQTTNLPIYLIWAGLEPLQFINLFPEWMYRDDVAELNIEVRLKGLILLSLLFKPTYAFCILLLRKANI